MQLGQLETFLAIVREGTVTAAAISLGLAPSSVSAQIRALERSLDVTLFERTAGGMRLTKAGHRMRPWAQRLLEQTDQARRDITDAKRTVRFGALETLAATHIPTIIARLADRRPDIAIDVKPSTRREDILTEVSTGELDVGLLFDTGNTLGSLGFSAPAQVDFCDLDPVPLAVVAAADHPLSGRSALTTEQVARYQLLVSPPSCSFRMAAEHLFGNSGPQTELGSITIVRAWASQGLGIALLPEFTISAELAAGTLLRLDLAAKVPQLALRLIWRRDSHNSQELRHVLYAASG